MNMLKPEPNGSDERFFSQMLDAVCAHCPCSGKKAEEWVLYAQVVAPFMVAFVEWIFKSANQDNVKRLYFLARDGQILWKIASRLIKAGVTDIDCRYLFASRQALHLPGHIDISQSKNWILENTNHLSIQTIAGRLQTDPIKLSQALGISHSQPFDKNLSTVERNEISFLIEMPSALQLINSSTQQAFNLASGYFRQEGLLSEKPVPFGLVDVGWHGRLQRSIENILKKNGAPCSQVYGYYLALNDHFVFSGVDAKRLKAFMYAPSGPHEGKWILDHVEMIELLHAADHASTMCYTQHENGLYGATFLPSQLKNGADFRHHAILAFVDEYAKLRTQFGRAISMPSCIKNIKKILHWPNKRQAELFIEYEHSEHQDEQQSSPYVVKKIPYQYTFIGPAHNIHGRWPEGSHALNKTILIYRLLRTASKIKKKIIPNTKISQTSNLSKKITQ